MSVNAAIRELRKASGLSRQVFATHLGLSTTAMQNYEKDRHPDPKSLFALLCAAEKLYEYDIVAKLSLALAKDLGTTDEMATLLRTMAMEGGLRDGDDDRYSNRAEAERMRPRL